MFLVDSALVGSNENDINDTIKTILEKAGAEIVTIKKWDDRKLAYEIRGKNRGIYILCYFRAEGEKINDIENSVKLSEQIMRVLILNAEKMTAEDMEKDTPAGKMEKETRQEPVETQQNTDDAVENDVDEQVKQQDETDTETEQEEPAEQKPEEISDSEPDSEKHD
jgi:small subunit ribosomal protein S6